MSIFLYQIVAPCVLTGQQQQQQQHEHSHNGESDGEPSFVVEVV